MNNMEALELALQNIQEIIILAEAHRIGLINDDEKYKEYIAKLIKQFGIIEDKQ